MSKNTKILLAIIAVTILFFVLFWGPNEAGAIRVDGPTREEMTAMQEEVAQLRAEVAELRGQRAPVADTGAGGLERRVSSLESRVTVVEQAVNMLTGAIVKALTGLQAAVMQLVAQGR